MTEFMIIGAAILLICVIFSKFLYRFGVPSLLIFLVLGMLFGSDGIGGIYFDNYRLAKDICSIGLVFIMFYGGFCTNWQAAKPVAVQSILLSSWGTIITAALTGLFCYLVLRVTLLEGLLIGAIVSSTDAASVFSILRQRKLNLKGGLASLLEIESGSNDPFAYMLTVMILTLMSNNHSQSMLEFLGAQLIFGMGLGVLLAVIMVLVMRRITFEIDGLYPIFVTAVIVLGYSLSEHIGGNGFLCVYIIGIILGNSRILHKKSLVHFFDGVSWLMQIMLFFVLGLLSFPSQMVEVMVPGILISLFMILVARPAATFSILSWFKIPVRQQAFVSWVGLRGAASIVFAIYAVTYQVAIKNDIFHIVFLVALFSVLVQGALIPRVARKLDLVEEKSSVFKTFNDYQEETHTRLVEYHVNNGHPWAGKNIMDANIPEEILVVMIKRKGDVVVPKGSTVIQEDDIMVLSGNDFYSILSGQETEEVVEAEEPEEVHEPEEAKQTESANRTEETKEV